MERGSNTLLYSSSRAIGHADPSYEPTVAMEFSYEFMRFSELINGRDYMFDECVYKSASLSWYR